MKEVYPKSFAEAERMIKKDYGEDALKYASHFLKKLPELKTMSICEKWEWMVGYCKTANYVRDVSKLTGLKPQITYWDKNFPPNGRHQVNSLGEVQEHNSEAYEAISNWSPRISKDDFNK